MESIRKFPWNHTVCAGVWIRTQGSAPGSVLISPATLSWTREHVLLDAQPAWLGPQVGGC